MDDLLVKYARDKFYREWVSKIPEIHFPKSWGIQIIPPFGGAIVRFQVNDRVSVYLDVDNSLGYWTDAKGNAMPYWEVYPYDDDVFRCDMNDISTLLKAIAHSLRQTKSKG